MVVLSLQWLLDNGYDVQVKDTGDVVISPAGHLPLPTAVTDGFAEAFPEVPHLILDVILSEATEKAATQQLMSVVAKTPQKHREAAYGGNTISHLSGVSTFAGDHKF